MPLKGKKKNLMYLYEYFTLIIIFARGFRLRIFRLFGRKKNTLVFDMPPVRRKGGINMFHRPQFFF